MDKSWVRWVKQFGKSKFFAFSLVSAKLIGIPPISLTKGVIKIYWVLREKPEQVIFSTETDCEGKLYRNSFRADHRCHFTHHSSLNPCYIIVAISQWDQMASNKCITSLAPTENVTQLPCISLCSGRVHECLNLAAIVLSLWLGLTLAKREKDRKRKSWQLSTVISYIKCNSHYMVIRSMAPWLTYQWADNRHHPYHNCSQDRSFQGYNFSVNQA